MGSIQTGEFSPRRVPDRPATASAAADGVARKAWATVAIVAAAGALVALDTMVNIAFPAITASFEIEVSDIQWLVTTYVLTFASLLLAAGRLSDVFGHRRVLIVGLVMTGLGVGLCGIAHDYGWFLAARVLQGAG